MARKVVMIEFMQQIIGINRAPQPRLMCLGDGKTFLETPRVYPEDQHIYCTCTAKAFDIQSSSSLPRNEY